MFLPKNPAKFPPWGQLLGSLLLFTLLSLNPVLGCTYADSNLVTQNQSPSPSPLPSQAPMVPQAIADQVLADLAQRTGQPVSNFQIRSSTQENWTDSCLGLAQPGQLCAQVITPGWRLTVQSQDKTWTYRTNKSGRTILLEQ